MPSTTNSEIDVARRSSRTRATVPGRERAGQRLHPPANGGTRRVSRPAPAARPGSRYLSKPRL
jgi:hypothetical protein